MTGPVMATSSLDALEPVVRRRLPHATNGPAAARARRFMTERVFESAQFGDIAFHEGGMWTEQTDRSRARYAHGFLWFTDWVAAAGDDADLAQTALELTRQWRAHADEWRSDPSSMAFHDETTAQRLTMHLAMMDAWSKHLDEGQLGELHEFLDQTADLLASDTFHAGLNNHGMFQDIAVVNWAGVATWESEELRQSLLATALGRLNAYFRHAFTAEGVHIEHAPNYHLMVSRQLMAHLEVLRAVDHVELTSFEDLLAGTLAYATHAVTPTGVYPPVSDTTVAPLAGGASSFGDDHFSYAATVGKRGVEPDTRTLVLPQSGYAIHRSAWGDPDATYVFFSSAYNGDYHKHADENSLFLRHERLDLISEAGPNGYNYGDPLTKYAYSQYAHSTLVVDGTSIPRTGGDLATVTMSVSSADDDGFTATGRNARLREGVVHERTVDVVDADGGPVIEVTDRITAPSPHAYELLWHAGEDLEVIPHGQGYEVHHHGTKVMDAWWQADVPTRTSVKKGVAGRKPLGWRFPAMGQHEPNDVAVVSFAGTHVQIRTSIRLHDFTYRDRGVGPRSGWRRFESEVGVNHLRTKGRTQRRLVVAFTSMHQRGDFTYNYKPVIDAAEAEALYILDDFGDQGAYYLQDHGDRAIFRSVQALIRRTLEQLGLTPDDLVCVGSSKGATAALMHGMALGAGDIFVGGPQTLIGNFVAKPHPNVLEFMTGGTSEENIEELNRALYDLASDNLGLWRNSRITVLVGDKDHHYKGHVLPFIEHVQALGGTPSLVTLPGLTHGDFGPAYRDALASHLAQVLHGDSTPTDADLLVIQAAAESGGVTARVVQGSWREYSARLFRGGDHVATVAYGPRREFVFEGLSPGRYRVRVFGRGGADDQPVALTSNWVVVPAGG
ncbi:hypothetical protein AESSP_01602 [Aestuariimicrobium sp. T2.26MG-19.2B]|nr:hypothetical protein AESSP_01602 [Aestuariimicrobium sp. T2.26MG-19.2B]